MRSYATAAPLLSAEQVAELHLVEFFFPSGTLRYNTSTGDIDWNGFTWYAGHGLFDIKFPTEDTSLEAHGAVVTLAAMNPSMLYLALAERVKGKMANLYHMVMDPETFAIQAVQREFGGLVSQMEITSGASNA